MKHTHRNTAICMLDR